MRLRAHDDVPAADENELISLPLGIDFNDPGRNRIEAHRRRHNGADIDAERDLAPLEESTRPDRLLNQIELATAKLDSAD